MAIFTYRTMVLYLWIWTCTTAANVVFAQDHNHNARIAVIGGSISGSFLTKYLSDYDSHCQIHSITIYDPYDIPKDPRMMTPDGRRQKFVSPSASQRDGEEGQGPRVSSLTLMDGNPIELGASIIYSDNRLVVEMMEGDPTMKRKEVHGGGGGVHDFGESTNWKPKNGLGIYNGNFEAGNHTSTSQTFPLIWPLLTAGLTSGETTTLMLWRYNIDLWRMAKATEKALDSFALIYDLLRSTHVSTFYKSPNDIWDAVGLKYSASVSLDTFLDSINVSHPQHSWILRMVGFKPGRMRAELITAMNICNNNKNNTQMTGLAGLVNFAASQGDLFAVEGGNDQLIRSAIQQAKFKRAQSCQPNHKGNAHIDYITKRIKTVVSDYEKGMELFDKDGKLLGAYDIVILAAPLQFCDITFLTRGSMFDSQVLSPMILNRMIDEEVLVTNAFDHSHAIGKSLPDSATRPYTQVITTIISGGILNQTYFSINEDEKVPKSILMTRRGSEQIGLSSITELGPFLFKTFSSKKLTHEQITTWFGEKAIIEEVKVWGGLNGGATPDFNGGGESSLGTNFLLYSGSDGFGGEADKSALFYTNTMESAVAAIEISAIGAKAVAKLVAERLGLINVVEDIQDIQGDEL